MLSSNYALHIARAAVHSQKMTTFISVWPCMMGTRTQSHTCSLMMTTMKFVHRGDQSSILQFVIGSVAWRRFQSFSISPEVYTRTSHTIASDVERRNCRQWRGVRVRMWFYFAPNFPLPHEMTQSLTQVSCFGRNLFQSFSIDCYINSNTWRGWHFGRFSRALLETLYAESIRLANIRRYRNEQAMYGLDYNGNYQLAAGIEKTQIRIQNIYIRESGSSVTKPRPVRAIKVSTPEATRHGFWPNNKLWSWRSALLRLCDDPHLRINI